MSPSAKAVAFAAAAVLFALCVIVAMGIVA
jgi:hypothetical protein